MLLHYLQLIFLLLCTIPGRSRGDEEEGRALGPICPRRGLTPTRGDQIGLTDGVKRSDRRSAHHWAIQHKLTQSRQVDAHQLTWKQCRVQEAEERRNTRGILHGGYKQREFGNLRARLWLDPSIASTVPRFGSLSPRLDSSAILHVLSLRIRCYSQVNLKPVPCRPLYVNQSFSLNHRTARTALHDCLCFSQSFC